MAKLHKFDNLQATPMINPSNVLEVRNLSNAYEGRPLLKNISFSLEEGAILSLLGPSGSGKTTLLRLIAGLERAETGSIIFNGKDLQDLPPHRRNFGMMFQEYALFPHKDVWQNIAFGLEMQRCSPLIVTERIEAMLDLVGLQAFAHRKIDELSGGERQRVALARSLAPEPKLLLLDEPLGSLDRTLRDRLTGEIRAILKKLSVTAIFVTHDQAEAFSVADKIAVIEQGNLQQFDSPENLYRRPATINVAKFLGFANFIDGHLDQNGNFVSIFGSLPLNGDTRRVKQSATLLLRPDGAKLAEPQAVATDALHLCGMVSERRFQGGSYRVSMKIGRESLSFDLPLDPLPPEIGATICVFFNRSAFILLDKEPQRDHP